MLYSAKHRFIYIKSAKTASTSVESALEVLIRGNCAPGLTNSLLYPDGSRIGYRGSNKTEDPNFGTSAFSFNHMAASDICELLGKEIFDKCLKISSIRNPYDRCISAFHHFGKQPLCIYTSAKEQGHTEFAKQPFHQYLSNHHSAKYDGRKHFFINERLIVDKFIRQECIKEDVQSLLALLDVGTKYADLIVGSMPNLKKSGRNETIMEISDYYEQEALEIVNNRYEFWFDLGPYPLARSIAELKNLYG